MATHLLLTIGTTKHQVTDGSYILIAGYELFSALFLVGLILQ